MLAAVRKRMRSVALLAVAGALVVGGVAAAQSVSGESGAGGSQSGAPSGTIGKGGHPGGPPPGGIGGPMMQGLTYAEFHVQRKNGGAEVIRLDQGKITAVDSGSVTLSENDGSEVTVDLDADTQVMAKPGADSTVADLAVGQRVSVSGPEGGRAESVLVMPTKAELKAMGEGHGGPPLGPPPGASSEAGE